MKYSDFKYNLQKYGFEIYLTSKQIDIFPDKVPEKDFLSLKRQNNKVFILKHRNIEFTSKYYGKEVTADWILSFCEHNSKKAKQHTKQYLESLNERKEYEKAIAKKSQEKAILAREEHEKKRQSEIDKGSIRVAEGNKKEKGFGEGAIICPICRGDGGVKECFRCDGTGWIR